MDSRSSKRKFHNKGGGPKKVKDFECTLSQSSLSKTHVYMALEEFCESLLVAAEKHTQGGTHFHCYMRLHQPDRIVGLRGTVGINLFGDESEASWESIHLSTLRNSKHWIKYCTKEDTEPMFKNCDPGQFHIAYRCFQYISTHRTFSVNDAFIRQNPSLSRILREMHDEHWSSIARSEHDRACLQSTFVPDFTVNWVNNVTSLIDQNKHVYLYGKTGLGKTVLANWLLTKHNATYLPCGLTAWEFGVLKSGIRLAIASDVAENYMQTHRQTLLRLCDKEPVQVNVKCGSFKQVLYAGSLLIVSNFDPPEDEALARRFVFVNADTNGFQTVKTDVETVRITEEEMDSIEISSDEEDIKTEVPDQRSSNQVQIRKIREIFSTKTSKEPMGSGVQTDRPRKRNSGHGQAMGELAPKRHKVLPDSERQHGYESDNADRVDTIRSRRWSTTSITGSTDGESDDEAIVIDSD